MVITFDFAVSRFLFFATLFIYYPFMNPEYPLAALVSWTVLSFIFCFCLRSPRRCLRVLSYCILLSVLWMLFTITLMYIQEYTYSSLDKMLNAEKGILWLAIIVGCGLGFMLSRFVRRKLSK